MRIPRAPRHERGDPCFGEPVTERVRGLPGTKRDERREVIEAERLVRHGGLERRRRALDTAKAGAKGIPLDDELCESDPSTGKGAEQRYAAATAKLAAKGCGGCAIANAPGLRVDAESFLEANNAQIYCAGSTPFPGGDDTGFVPPDPSTARCEDAVVKALSKYMAGVVKCHRSAIKSGFKGGSHDDEACESGKAGAKYDAVIAKFVAFGCGGCGIANAPGLRTRAESFLDTKNGQVYCAGSTRF
jgi:hypothetical protein